MKIAVASTGLGHVSRGIESWAEDLGFALNKRGVDVTLFKGGGRPNHSFEQVVPCLRRNYWATRLMHSVTPRFFWRFGLGSLYDIEQSTFGWALISRLRMGRFDILHTQDPCLARFIEKARRLNHHHTKVILGHGTEESFEFLNYFDYVQELSPVYLEKDRQLGLSPDKMWFAIPNFVDCEKYRPGDKLAARKKFNIPPNRFVVLDVAALKITHKRLDWLAKEVARARQTCPEILLVIAGAVEAETPALSRLLQSELGEHCLVLTNLPRNQMPDLYRSADLFAHTALLEMMAIVVIEALASGIPCRVSTYPVLEWVVGNAGEALDMQRPGQLADSIIWSTKHPEVRTQRSEEARKRALDVFDTTPVVSDIIEMYRMVLGKTPS